VIVGYKKKWEKERDCKDRSREYIQKTHDAVIGMGKDIEYLKGANEKTNIRFTEHEVVAKGSLKDVRDMIENHTCTQSLETKEIVQNLVEHQKTQNGHLKDLKIQGDTTAETQMTLLLIAQGRRSLWKEIGIVIGSIVGIGGLIFAGITLWH